MFASAVPTAALPAKQLPSPPPALSAQHCPQVQQTGCNAPPRPLFRRDDPRGHPVAAVSLTRCGQATFPPTPPPAVAVLAVSTGRVPCDGGVAPAASFRPRATITSATRGPGQAGGRRTTAIGHRVPQIVQRPARRQRMSLREAAPSSRDAVDTRRSCDAVWPRIPHSFVHGLASRPMKTRHSALTLAPPPPRVLSMPAAKEGATNYTTRQDALFILLLGSSYFSPMKRLPMKKN